MPDLITFEGTVWADREGPCVDPFGHHAEVGAKLLCGGWTRRGREHEPHPPLMCDECMEHLRGLSVPDGKSTGDPQP